MGPLRADAPAWCLAPFEPEGLLRWKSDNINRRSWVFAVNNSSNWQSFPLSVQYRQYYQGQSGYITAMSWSISRLFLITCFDLWVFMKCNVVMKVSDLQSHKERLRHWLLMGFSLLALGILLHFTKGTYPCIFPVIHRLPFAILELRFYMHCSALAAIPINKQLCSFSYVCFTGGAAGIVLSAFYILVWFILTFFYQKFVQFHFSEN